MRENTTHATYGELKNNVRFYSPEAHYHLAPLSASRTEHITPHLYQLDNGKQQVPDAFLEPNELVTWQTNCFINKNWGMPL